jgi:hypothetical protein
LLTTLVACEHLRRPPRGAAAHHRRHVAAVAGPALPPAAPPRHWRVRVLVAVAMARRAATGALGARSAGTTWPRLRRRRRFTAPSDESPTTTARSRRGSEQQWPMTAGMTMVMTTLTTLTPMTTVMSDDNDYKDEGDTTKKETTVMTQNRRGSG